MITNSSGFRDSPPDFEAVDHTADLALIARGQSLGQLFASAALGMTSFLLDLSSIELRMEHRIEFEGQDAEEALVAWLQELIYEEEVHRRVFGSFEVVLEETDSGTLGKATCRGEVLDPTRHSVHTDIKAATYHDLHIDRPERGGSSGFSVRIVFDI